MDEIKRSLACLWDVADCCAEIGHAVADLARNLGRLTDEQRQALADHVDELADRIEEKD